MSAYLPRLGQWTKALSGKRVSICDNVPGSTDTEIFLDAKHVLASLIQSTVSFYIMRNGSPETLATLPEADKWNRNVRHSYQASQENCPKTLDGANVLCPSVVSIILPKRSISDK